MSGDNLKVRAICDKIIYTKDAFCIASFTDDNGYSFSLKGNYYASINSAYNIIAQKDDNDRYPNSYKAISLSYDIDLSKVSKSDLRKFLATLTSEKNAKSIVDTLENPVEALENRDIKTLSTVKGVGAATACRLVELYDSQKDKSADIMMLSKYGFSDSLIKSLLSHYGNGENAVKVIENNVYDLVKVKGIGFKKADLIFLKHLKGAASDTRRGNAFADYIFLQKYQDGHTWLSPSQFVALFKEEMPSCDLKATINYINDSDNFESHVDKNGDKRLSLSEVSKIERSLAYHLMCLKVAESNVINKNLQDTIHKIEQKQGWKYDESQRKAIQEIEENNAVLVQGLAGTGKSTIINAYVTAAISNGYTIKQCALSGKAASNLSSITGIAGNTIHSTLMVDFAHGGFKFNKNNPLFADIVIVDEISMVNLSLFTSLVEAIRQGAKLIVIGDNGQLDSIGAGVMKPLADSGFIKAITLTNVHRQAEDSAIITHSIDFRNQRVPKGLSLKTMTNTAYGVNGDLRYLVLPDGDSPEENSIINSKLLMGVSGMYKKLIEKYDIKDIQIITQTITNGLGATEALNSVAQGIYNPKLDDDKVWVKSRKGDKTHSELRVGDRVINNVNNKDVKTEFGEDAAIFNGSMGTVVDIVPNNHIVVDFDDYGRILLHSKDILNISLGYAITVHKSQGSTIPHLIFILGYNYMLNSVEMLYTGITRAGKDCIVVTTPKAIKRSISRSVSVAKNSNLKMFMEKAKQTMEENTK